MISLHADLHTHTISSGHAYGSVKEMIEGAAEKGLDLIAITDHAPAMPGSCQALHFSNLRSIPRQVKGVTVLRGVEANVLNRRGTLDLPDRILRRLDWVIASLHDNVLFPEPGTSCTELYLTLAENPMVDMIGHPDSPEFPFDAERVIPALGANGKVVELNSHHAFKLREENRDNARHIVELCARHNVFIAVNSDAHSPWNIGETAPAVAMLEAMGFPESLILNASAQRVLDYVRSRKPGLLSA